MTIPNTTDLTDAVVSLGALSLTFGTVPRITRHPDGTTLETDTTHTVMLTLIGCAVAEACFPQLDVGLVAQFAAVHDVVEAYAGDTPTLRELTPAEKAAKKQREHEAYQRIRDEYAGTLPWLPWMIRRYEEQQEVEARYVRALDKVLPKITHILNGAVTVRAQGMSVAELTDRYAAQLDELKAYASDFPELLEVRDVLVGRVLAILAVRPPAEEASDG